MSADSKRKSIRAYPCPKCHVLMRRLYIQQSFTESGKRRNRFIAIGRGCMNCGHVSWDRKAGDLKKNY